MIFLMKTGTNIHMIITKKIPSTSNNMSRIIEMMAKIIAIMAVLRWTRIMQHDGAARIKGWGATK